MSTLRLLVAAAGLACAMPPCAVAAAPVPAEPALAGTTVDGARTTPDGEVAAALAPGGSSFAVRRLAAADADATGATLTFEAELANGSASAVALDGVSWALELGGRRLAEGSLPGGAALAPGGVAAVTFPGRVTWADLPALAAKTALGGRVPYRLVASATLRTPSGPLVVPLVHEGELATPRPPEVGLHRLKIVSMNPLDAAVEVHLAVENDNAFGLPPGALRYRITIAGGEISAAEAALPAVAPRGKVVVAIPLKLSLRRLGTGVVQALKGDSALVGLHAVASLGPMEWPVDVEARLPAVR